MVRTGAGAGEGRLKLLKDSLFRGRARSGTTLGSGFAGVAGAEGAGEEGRLAGRKKEGFLSACIIAWVTEVWRGVLCLKVSERGSLI